MPTSHRQLEPPPLPSLTVVSPLYAESINDVTFGAGVSYIGTPRTPSSAKGKFLVSFWADICAAFEVLGKLNLFV